ncbi:hypothetical protein BS50DRAFT_594325 [Corynespora cassiicola Philippines]|uniref:DUF2306 domain-containing protein n=1 Tax=Corynespora cassiicola Philippines TaxID=1448308 RepID=A0A2T2N3C4_CORCC|nr:hypothetical protein BS50DRAFT_594325 [Corynespora cassiicola Philippines]
MLSTALHPTRVITSREGLAEARKKTSTAWTTMTVAAVLTALYALHFILGTPPGNPIVKERLVGSASGLLHVICGLLALIIGPMQFRKTLTREHPKVHIWLGRIYMFCILFSGISALKVSFKALGYPIGNAGFALLATVWIYTASRGLYAILRGDVLSHTKWMTRNFALTYAAPVLRVLLPLMMAVGMDGKLALSINGYLSWIPNIIFAEVLIRKRVIKLVGGL